MNASIPIIQGFAAAKVGDSKEGASHEIHYVIVSVAH